MAQNGAVELYLPWESFEHERLAPILSTETWIWCEPSAAALEMASHFHPIWDRLKQGARKLHARNCHQVLGGELNSRADLIVCWTPGGGIDGSSSKSGGTGMALRIATAYGPIGVINLANENHLSYVQKMMSPFVFKDRKIS